MNSLASIKTAVVAAALAAPATLAFAAPPEAPGKAIVMVVRAVSACFSDQVRVTGLVVPRAEVFATVDSEGFKITEVLAAEGERVKAGQALAKLTRMSAPPGTAPPAGAQQAGAAGAGGAGSSTMTLSAPAAGTVTRRAATVGAFASPPSQFVEPLFRIALEGQLELEVEVPSPQMPKLRVGQPARIAVDGGPELSGKVRTVGGEIEQRTQLGKLRLSVDSDAALRSGMFARVTIDAARSCGVSIPSAALIRRSEGTSVQVIRNDVVETRAVRVGLMSDTSTEIREGLKADDIVVATAGTSLHDGDQVKTVIVDEAELARGR
jgi:multidrug efflux pump subunit AcrA (membrane-fusion protein)